MSSDLEFTVRGPLAATWPSDEDHRTRPGSCILDLLFTSPNKVGELIFRNYYTAWITVLVRVPNQNTKGRNRTGDMESVSSWKLAIPRRVLMPFPHQETGSHDIVSISASESMIEWNNVQGIRLLLQQPSPVWRTFHIEEISVMREIPRRLPKLTNNHPNNESRIDVLKDQTLIALKKSNAPEREGPPPKDFVGLVGYEVQGLLTL